MLLSIRSDSVLESSDVLRIAAIIRRFPQLRSKANAMTLPRGCDGLGSRLRPFDHRKGYAGRSAIERGAVVTFRAVNTRKEAPPEKDAS